MPSLDTVSLVVVAYRLGLSWLVGRRHVLLTISNGASVQRVVAPFRWRDGVMVVDEPAGASWVSVLQSHPVVMAQAAPGPLAVAAEFHNDGTISLPATGRPAPLPVVPDLLWLYPVALPAFFLVRRLLRCR